MKHILKQRKLLFYWLASWGIVAFGQPGWSLILSPFAAVCGYALFWLILAEIKERRFRFFYSCTWFMCVQAIHLSWMTATAYHGFYILIVYFCILVWFGIQFGVLSLCFPSDLKLSVLHCMTLASIWTLMEWSRFFVFCGFPFNLCGVTLAAFPLSSQLASIIGVLGLSFLVILMNTLGLRAFLNFKRDCLSSYLGLISFIILFGAVHLTYHQNNMNKTDALYKVALIQTGLRPEEKTPLSNKIDSFISPFEQWESILSYLKDGEPKNLDLIVLPEAALPYGAYQDVYFIEDVKWILNQAWGEGYQHALPEIEEERSYVSNAFWAQAMANYYQCEVIAGFDDHDASTGKSYNAALHFFPKETEVKRYEKCILVPLAEYLPLPFLLPLVARYGIFDFATHGTGAKVFGEKVPIAISVCYEECFSHLIRQGRLKGARLFVNVTNDGWYFPSKLPQQHFYHARLRSLENGVPLVRACNTGITTVIDSIGRIRGQLQDKKGAEIFKGALITSFPLYHYKTLYRVYGDFLVVAMSMGIVVLFAIRSRIALNRLTITI